MNTATQTFEQGNLFVDMPQSLAITREMVTVIVLSCAVLLSAVSVIFMKSQERKLMADIQLLQRHHNVSQVEFSQLLLEQSAWATPARIQKVAQQHLNMEPATPSRITMIKL